MSEKTQTPFTTEQADALNRYQTAGRMHPFTCDGNRSDAAHKAEAKRSGKEAGLLVATPEGWQCPACDYRQAWAHGFMSDGSV